ncbi:hypothetical protein KLP28_04885 [Nocardioidaceae bacterium]|nr:hypothetical protein KLP28_04885 [Nocardioidaceae bacterium]
MVVEAAQLQERERYARDHTSPGSRDLAKVERQAHEDAPARVVAELLATLVHVGSARRVLDLGLATGASALAMATAIGEAYEGDATAARSLATSRSVVACAPHPAALGEVRRALAQARHGDLVRVVSSRPEAVLAELLEPVDLVRVVLGEVPGGLTPERARVLVRTLLDRTLLGPRGLLVVENTQDPTSFNEWLHGEQRLRQVLMPLAAGLTLARPAR